MTTIESPQGRAIPAGYQIFHDPHSHEDEAYVVCAMGQITSAKHVILGEIRRFDRHYKAVDYVVKTHGWTLWSSGYDVETVPTLPDDVERTAVVTNFGTTLSTVQTYLPRNYTAAYDELGRVVITGHDYAGWTLNGYVIPRLASGLISAEEVQS